MHLPETFLEKMNQLLGEGYEAWLKSFEKNSFRGLRVNTSKVEVEEFVKISPFPLQKVPWTENGFYIPEDANASRHPYYAAGLYYLQEPSAMAPAAQLPIQEGDRVLDLCAAPGGKATELASRLRGSGLLVANDISNSRAKALLKNLELFGSGNILVTSETPERLSTYFPEFFDKILIDAPCSGEGMFRKDPTMVKDWQVHGPSYYAALQKEILTEAHKLLKPGGMLLYSTCTFSVEENEGSILHLLRQFSGYEVLPLSCCEGFAPGRPDLLEEPVNEEEAAQLKHCVHMFPHRLDGEGHFLTLLRKRENTEQEIPSLAPAVSKKGKEHTKQKPVSSEEWENFANLLRLPIARNSLRLYGEKLYALPEALCNTSLRGLRFLRTGLYLGEVQKKRFEPSQALAMTLKKEDFKNCLNFSAKDERILRYLKGETLCVEDLLSGEEENGWQLICVNGYPCGWGKLTNGMLKNKYYAGWRW